MGSGALAGRAAELDEILGELRADGSVLLAGGAGVGKSHLARETAAVAERDGLLVVKALASVAAREIPLGCFAALSAGSSGATAGLVPARDEIRRLGADGTVVLVIDDAHLLDDTSAALVHQVTEAGEARVLATARSGELLPAEILDLWRRGSMRRVEVEPFGIEATGGLFEQLVGRAPAEQTLAHLFEVTAGNPLYVREYVNACLDRNAFDDVDGELVLTGSALDSPRLADLVSARMANLSAGDRELLVHIAFAEPAPIDLVGALATDEALMRLEDADLIAITDDQRRLEVRLSHPLFGEVLRSTVRPIRRRQILGTLAENLRGSDLSRPSDRLLFARLAVDGGRPVDTDVLVEASSSARLANDGTLAERLARVAFEQDRTFPVGQALAAAIYQTGDRRSFDAHLADWTVTIDSPSRRARLATLASDAAFWLGGDVAAASGVIGEHLEYLGGAADSDPAGQLRLAQAAIDMQVGDAAGAFEVCRPFLEGDPGPNMLRATAVAVVALRLLGRPLEAVELADRIVEGARLLGPQAVEISEKLILGNRTLALTEAGRASEAVAVCDQVLRTASDETEIATFRLVRAHALSILGRFSDAVPDANDADRRLSLPWARAPRKWALTARVYLAAELGNVAEAESCLAELAGAGAHPSGVWDGVVDRAVVWHQHAVGQPERARQEALDRAAGRRALGEVYELHLLHDHLRLGGSPEVIGRIVEIGGSFEGGLYAAMVLHAEALRQGDPDSLAAAADCFAAVGANHLAACAADNAAGAALKRGDRRGATRHRRNAAEWREACGISVGSLAAVEGPGPMLSRREREVASLAAQGVTSKDIGERLFISNRTVDNHLARVFDKLGVRSRSELAVVLGAAVGGSLAVVA